jgi:translation initiation factor IF-2
MTDKKNPGETLTVTPTKTLTLKRTGVEQGMVRQSFSHGRTKSVVVEKVKRRMVGPGEAKAEPAPAAAPAAPPVRRTPVSGRTAPAAASPSAAPAGPGGKPSGVVLRTLTEEERSARAHALADAKVREAEERRVAEDDARRGLHTFQT